MRSKNPELMKRIKGFVESYYHERGETPSTQIIADAVNTNHEDIYVSNLSIQGVARHIIKAL